MKKFTDYFKVYFLIKNSGKIIRRFIKVFYKFFHGNLSEVAPYVWRFFRDFFQVNLFWRVESLVWEWIRDLECILTVIWWGLDWKWVRLEWGILVFKLGWFQLRHSLYHGLGPLLEWARLFHHRTVHGGVSGLFEGLEDGFVDGLGEWIEQMLGLSIRKCLLV